MANYENDLMEIEAIAPKRCNGDAEAILKTLNAWSEVK